jgi:hypothetical protein
MSTAKAFAFVSPAEQMLGARSLDVLHAMEIQSVRARVNSTIDHNDGGVIF